MHSWAGQRLAPRPRSLAQAGRRIGRSLSAEPYFEAEHRDEGLRGAAEGVAVIIISRGPRFGNPSGDTRVSPTQALLGCELATYFRARQSLLERAQQNLLLGAHRFNRSIGRTPPQRSYVAAGRRQRRASRQGLELHHARRCRRPAAT